MNLNSLCFVLLVLLIGAFSKSIDEAPLTREVDKKLDEKMTIKTIVNNSNDKIENEKNDRNLENILEDLIPPENELKDTEEGRTFGVKRLQFMLMPMIYKMGVIMTLLTVLTVISLKGLAIGVILLVLKLGTIFGKFYATSQSHGSNHGWAPQAPQPVHVHVHNNGGSNHQQSPYNGWEAASGPSQDEHYYYKG